MPSTTIYANKDAIIAETNLGAGADQHLPIGYNSWLPGDSRAYVGYSYSFTGWTAITSAVAYFKTSDGNNHIGSGNWSDPDVYVDLVTSSWSEGTAGETWRTDNAIRWNAGLPSVSSTNRVTWDVGGASNPAINTWYSVDVTAMMQQALASGAFYGFRLMSVVEGSGGDRVEFVSREGGAAPYIVITYSTNSAPNAPTSLSPTGSALQNTLTPTFSGTFSDPDSGDTMTGVQIQVVDDANTVTYWDSGTLAASGTTFSKAYAGYALAGNAYYLWRARTKDAAGAWGPYSAWQRFKANSAPYSPSVSLDGSASDQLTLTPNFYITHNDPDASDTNLLGYHAIVVRSSDGATMWDTGDVAEASTRTKTLAYAGTALAWQTQYYVIARTKDSNGAWGPYSSALYFTTHTTATPTSLDPSASEVAGSLTPTFTGSRGSSNDSLASAQIQVYASDGTTLIWDSGTFTSGVTTTGFSKAYGGTALSNATTYKWRARVTGAIGGTSAWTALQTFISPDTNAPSATAPVGSGITSLTPSFQFSRAASFNRHQLYVYASDGTTLIWSDTPASYTAATSKSVTYAGTALAYGTTYKWKVRVSSDGGTTWSPYAGLITFTTDAAGIPTLTAPSDGSWQTTTTPTFTGTTYNAETISTYRVYVYAADQTTLIWDSGDLAGSGTSFSKVYAGSTALTKGSQYWWTAKYTKTGGVPGGLAPKRSFHINADPSAPTDLIPSAGTVVADDTSPDFYATFVDADIANWGDTPSTMTVEVYRVSDSVLMHTLTKNTGLVAGQNSVTRTTEGTALSYEVEYMYRARYVDSKSASGAWSQYVTFKPSQSPSVSITAPGVTLASPSFNVTWTFSSPGGKTQQKYRVVVIRVADAVTLQDTGEVVSSATSWTMPSGYLVNGEDYDIYVYLWDTDGLLAHDSVTTSQMYAVVSATASWTPPPAPASFAATADPESSTVKLSWEASTLSDTEFSFYSVYRREVGDEAFAPYDAMADKTTTEYTDRYAANQVVYDYKVTQFQKVPGDVDLESAEDSVASAVIDLDGWFVIGADGSAEHSVELPVVGESHQRPIQQEVFEPLGARRKKTARGNTLGYEGTMDCVWGSDEREDAKRFLTYIAETAGPHILKSPFGDVWNVEFSAPQYKYAPAGGVAVTIAWIEVA